MTKSPAAKKTAPGRRNLRDVLKLPYSSPMERLILIELVRRPGVDGKGRDIFEVADSIWGCKPDDVIRASRSIGREKSPICYAPEYKRIALIMGSDWKGALARASKDLGVHLEALHSKQDVHALGEKVAELLAQVASLETQKAELEGHLNESGIIPTTATQPEPFRDEKGRLKGDKRVWGDDGEDPEVTFHDPEGTP